jgi:hypothetical protein
LASCDGSTGLKSKINTLTTVGSGLLRSPEELIARSRISTYCLAVTKPLAKLSAAKVQLMKNGRAICAVERL